MSDAVTLVIPGRNCGATLEACLDAVTRILEAPGSALRRIIFIDDGSTDDTAAIAARFPVDVLPGGGKGPGAARNLGWRAASTPLVWFVDADCVAEPDALDLLLPHLDDPAIAAVSGSYGIANPSALLARLIHEEIVDRHRRMGREVDFLATFNVIYRRAVLESLDGFDERYLKAQDAELSFRAREAGHRLGFELESRVRHYHEERWLGYLRTQRRQGFWRVWLHMEHPGFGARNSYSGALDHLQPPLAMLVLAALPLLAVPLPLGLRFLAPALAVVLLALQVPLTARLVRHARDPGLLAFVPMGALRAAWRGVGMTHGTIRYMLGRLRR